MVQKSASKRIRVTKNGKVMRRAGTLGHSRANKNHTAMGRKKRARSLDWPNYLVKKYS